MGNYQFGDLQTLSIKTGFFLREARTHTAEACVNSQAVCSHWLVF